jgi:branched-chain amino acid transport system ATP-binding protein
MVDPPLLLEGSGLGKRYGGVVALADVTIHLAPGEILGLVGPNGAGKTTLVDCISGTQSANSGTLTLKGAKLSGPASRRAKLGLARTFQYPQLAQDLTVGENLLLGRVAMRHGSWWRMIVQSILGTFWVGKTDDATVVESIAEELQITRLDRLAGDLTLGEQRLLEVGRALGQDPVVLLLDEPFAGSDASGVAGIIEVIRTVQRRGHGIILVDHNVDLVSSLVDRIMLLDQGHVVFDGDPAQCIASPEMQRVYFGVLAPEDESDPDAPEKADAGPEPTGPDGNEELRHVP